MATASAPASVARAQRLEQEHALDLVESAIALIAAGGARRATLVLEHPELILPTAQDSGRRWGVVVRADWRSDGGCDVVVEPVA